MSVQSCLNRLNDIDRVVYDSYKCVLNESYKFDTKVDVMCKYERDLDIVYELCGLHESYEYDYVSEYNDLIHSINEYNTEYIQEGFGQKVKDFFKKVLEILKKFFSFIGRMLKALFDKLFRRKAKKTADQVAEECITGSHVKEYMESGDETGTGSTKVHFPASPDSVIKECDLELITKSLLIKIENNNYVIGLAPGFEGARYESRKGTSYKPFINNGKTRDSHTNMFLAYVENRDDYRTIIDNIINYLVKYKDYEFTDEAVLDSLKFNDDLLKSRNKLEGDKGWRYSFSSKLAIQYMNEINQLTNKVNQLNTIPESTDKRYKSLLDNVVDVVNELTYGCNNFATNVKAMYVIDQKYLHTISDIDILSKFVDTMITAGIPTTQVAYNTWCVMSPNFDDRKFFFRAEDNDDASSTFPRWGQTRVVFFPDNKPMEVLKIALNGAGKLANKREFQIYKQYQKYHLENELAEPISHTNNFCVMMMEKMKMLPENERNKYADLVKAELKEHYKQNPNLTDITGDLHGKNIGYDEENNIKVIDYAG